MSLNRRSSTWAPILTAGSAAEVTAALSKAMTSGRNMRAAPVAGRDADQSTDRPPRPPQFALKAVPVGAHVEGYGSGNLSQVKSRIVRNPPQASRLCHAL